MKRSVTKKPKLTKWFDGSVKPVRDGVYQRKTDGGDFRYWIFMDGFWRYGGFGNAEMCVTAFSDRGALSQSIPWRGLAQNPEVQP